MGRPIVQVGALGLGSVFGLALGLALALAFGLALGMGLEFGQLKPGIPLAG